MTSQGARIQGLRETVRSLERFGVEAKDLKSAFKRIGTLVQREAQSLAPKRSGSLAASIRPSNTKNKSVIYAGSARVPYAGVQEFGNYNNITARVYLRGAVKRKQGQAVDLMEKELNDLLRKLDLRN